METLISAIQKTVIKNIVLYADQKIKIIKNVVNTAYFTNDHCFQKEKFSKSTTNKLSFSHKLFYILWNGERVYEVKIPFLYGRCDTKSCIFVSKRSHEKRTMLF